MGTFSGGLTNLRGAEASPEGDGVAVRKTPSAVYKCCYKDGKNGDCFGV